MGKIQISIPTTNPFANADPFPSTDSCTGNGFFSYPAELLPVEGLRGVVSTKLPEEYGVVMNSSLEL